MKIEVGPEREVILKEVYSGILFIAGSGETLSVCMRDNGFEFKYDGKWYFAKDGQVGIITFRDELDTWDDVQAQIEATNDVEFIMDQLKKRFKIERK